jgi:hypothetical protein
MTENYGALKAALEAAGFHTTFMPITTPGDRMVCASRRHTSGTRSGCLGGTSFWVAKRGDEWFVATWFGLPYRVMDEERLVALCLELLNRENGKALSEADLDEGLRNRFALVPISPEEFDRLKP